MNLTDNFLSIVLSQTPLLDVRAPIEFQQGAFINATNIAILNDEQRHLVGIHYKEAGNSAAVKLAEQLIQEEGQKLRIKKWQEYLQSNPNALLYCFRGGQRSAISQAWLKEVGINITRLKGGYKAFRSYLMDESLKISANTKTLILGGRTGSGKTVLLQEINNMIDLEAIAHHRGSSFGHFSSDQPSQINFENNLAYKLIQHHHANHKYLIIEHESHNIGRAFIPKPLYKNLMDGRLIILETPLKERIEITYHEYIEESLLKYTLHYKEDALSKWAQDVQQNLEKIKKRLGSEKYIIIKKIFEDAVLHHFDRDGKKLYKLFIEKLLVEYYDPMYDYQIKTTQIPIILRGDKEVILNFIYTKEDD